MSNETIRAAIEGRLIAWAKAQAPPIPVALENGSFKPTIGQRYLQGFMLPAETLNPSQGGTHQRYHGIYQVDVKVQEGAGPGEGGALATAIERLFPCPTTLVKNGLAVHIHRTPSIANGRPDGAGFYSIPVTIRYTTDIFS